MKIPVMKTINVSKKNKISLNQYSSSTFFFHDEDDACDLEKNVRIYETYSCRSSGY